MMTLLVMNVICGQRWGGMQDGKGPDIDLPQDVQGKGVVGFQGHMHGKGVVGFQGQIGWRQGVA